MLLVMFFTAWLLFALLATAELVAGYLMQAWPSMTPEMPSLRGPSFQACRKSSCWMASTVLARGFGASGGSLVPAFQRD